LVSSLGAKIKSKKKKNRIFGAWGGLFIIAITLPGRKGRER